MHKRFPNPAKYPGCHGQRASEDVESNGVVSARSASCEYVAMSEASNVYNFGDLWIDHVPYFKFTLKDFPIHRGLVTKSSFQRKQDGRFHVISSFADGACKTMELFPIIFSGRRGGTRIEVSKHLMQPE